MKARVSVETRRGTQSYLVETDRIRTPEVRKAVEYAVENPNGTIRYTNEMEVVNGTIVQTGHLEDIEEARVEIPTVSVE
jgi:hypothetical protein